MSVTLPRTLFNFLCCHTNHNFVLRRISRFITPRNYALSWESVEDRRFTPPFQSVRFKSKSKIRRDSVKVISLTDDLKLSIKDHEMTEEYNKVVASFQNDLCQRLCLRLTPEILYSIPIPNERVLLGDVAAIISLTSAQSTSIQPTSQILVDLSGRPELVASAKAAISEFLLRNSDLSASKRGNVSSSYSDLIQDVDQTQFTVRLRTFVTGDVREELIKKGREMLHRTKKEMDRIYQKFSKYAATLKSLSEDDRRTINEYLKSAVKTQHEAAERVWEAKKQELLNDRT